MCRDLLTKPSILSFVKSIIHGQLIQKESNEDRFLQAIGDHLETPFKLNPHVRVLISQIRYLFSPLSKYPHFTLL